MAIQVASNLVPRNGNTWPVVEDIFVKGGYRTVADLAARDAIDPSALKPGMMVFVQSENAHFKLDQVGPPAWVQTGLEGPTGPAGPTGPQGPAGATGPKGSDSELDAASRAYLESINSTVALNSENAALSEANAAESALAAAAAARQAGTRIVSTSAPSGVPLDGQEWIVVSP